MITSAVLLAAGRSTRMGKQNKLLAPFNGRSLVATVVAQVLATDIDHLIVVTGYESEKVKADIEQGTHSRENIQIIDNADYHQGIASSLGRGVKALPDDTCGALILLADMPSITEQHIHQLVAEIRRTQGKDILVPCYRGTRGNPVWWPREYFEEILALEGDVGARELLMTYAERWVTVEFSDDAILRDIDTIEQLDELREEE